MRILAIFLLLAIPALGYEPPIGIPDPADTFGVFGEIDQTAPSGSSNWPSAEEAGYYYIDSTHVSATDSANTYGYPDKPRATIPTTNYSAGDRIEVAAGDYNIEWRPRGVGTAASPVWFIFGEGATVNSVDLGFYNQDYSYLVFDNIETDGNVAFDARPRYDGSTMDHIILRNCTFTGTATASDSTGVAIGATSASDTTRTINDFVIYNCEISYYGDWSDPGEECAVYPRAHVTRLWVLDSNLHHVAEDALAGSHGGQRTSTDYYIGRNTIHDNQTNAIDIKGMGRVVVSENTMYNHQDIWEYKTSGALLAVYSRWIDVSGSPDFSNVGAGAGPYSVGDYFTASAGTPTDWGTAEVAQHTSSGIGQAVTFHFGGTSSGSGSYLNFPEDCSLLFNTIYASRYALRTSGCGKLRIIGNVIYGQVTAPTEYTENTAALQIGGIKGDTWVTHNTIYGSDRGIYISSGAVAYNAGTTYYRGDTVVNGGVYYVCIDDNSDVGISGIAPPNATYWQAIRVEIGNNIIAGRTNDGGQSEIATFDTTLPEAALDMDYGITYYSGGEAYDYGGTARTLAYMVANTDFLDNADNSDPLFVSAGTNDFTLAGGSPAIDTGVETVGATSGYDDFFTEYGISIEVDRLGNARPYNGTWDMGAYESGASPPDPPATGGTATATSATATTVNIGG